jgi:hypothetical protein
VQHMTIHHPGSFPNKHITPVAIENSYHPKVVLNA